MEQGIVEGRNMSALEKKVDALLQFCAAETEIARSRCRRELKTLIGVEEDHWWRCPNFVDGALTDLGIPDHLLGYGYLQTAIRLAMQDKSLLREVTSRLYPMVAQQHNTRPQLVERGIRHAIECGWVRCDLKVQQQYFGGKIDPKRCKPTNSEFIARLCNVVNSQYS